MKAVDIEKLSDIIEAEITSPSECMLYRDSFAIACYLHLAGHEIAAAKLCTTILESLGCSQRKVYFTNVMKTFGQNAKEYAMAIDAHSEIRKLFPE